MRGGPLLTYSLLMLAAIMFMIIFIDAMMAKS